MYLFFDTETTGLPKTWQAPVEDLENWPRLVQLAWLLTDQSGKEIFIGNRIVRPDGFLIPAAASSVHGITTERALLEGIELHDALMEFQDSIERSTLVIAHNMSFDEKIIGAEFLRKRINSNFFKLPKLCTMRASTDYLAIPGEYGFKWPRLSELHQSLFKTDFEGAHDAFADVRACARCFFELKTRGVL